MVALYLFISGFPTLFMFLVIHEWLEKRNPVLGFVSFMILPWLATGWVILHMQIGKILLSSQP